MDWTSIEAIAQLPKAELHAHLSGCIPAAVVKDLLQEFDTAEPPLDPAVLPIAEPVPSLTHYLERWSILNRLPRGPVCLQRIFNSVLAALKADGVVYAELRHSPLRVARLNDIPLETAFLWSLEALERAKSAVPGIDARFIFGIDRAAPDLAAIRRVFAEYKALGCPDRFVGLDVAGDEAAYPIGDDLARVIRGAAEALGLGVTIHAGETGPPENIRHAIEACSATRIGHGLAAVRSEPILELIQRRNVCVEVCLRSNLLTSAVASLAAHPVLTFIERDIAFTLCTDNPGVHGFTQSQEYHQFYRLTGRADLLEAMFDRQTAHAFAGRKASARREARDHPNAATAASDRLLSAE